ncbi:hypothetical protein HK098_004817 [Nowakowskiella sp. JEL0407]|nr:hypothetical protein HK098_004817 [Nowakowskiella sp. JEL0407]
MEVESERKELLSLPPEIHIQIAKFLPKSTKKILSPQLRTTLSSTAYFPLLNFALSCKSIYNAIYPSLYQNISLTRNLPSFLASADSNPEFSVNLTQFTREFAAVINCGVENLDELHMLSFRGLESLELHITDEEEQLTNFTPEVVTATVSLINEIPVKYTGLRKLQITADSFYGDLLVVVTGIIRQVKTIEHLALALNISPENLTNKMTDFAREISTLSNLKKFSFENHRQVNIIYLLPLDLVLKALKENLLLVDLTLTYYTLGKITYAALKQLISLSRLKRLWLNRIKLPEDDIFDCIRTCESLVDLQLNNVHGPPSMFEKLFMVRQYGVSKLPKTISITGELDPTQLVTFDFTAETTGLESLTLAPTYYSVFQYNLFFLENIFTALEKNCCTIRELTLFVPDQTLMMQMIQIIRQSETLTKLSLQIKMNLIDAEVAELFFSAIRDNSVLKSLKLDCLDEMDYSDLAAVLEGNRSLQEVTLTVKFTDTIADYLFKLLSATVNKTNFKRLSFVLGDGDDNLKKLMEFEYHRNESGLLHDILGPITMRLYNYTVQYYDVTMSIFKRMYRRDELVGKVVVDELAEEELERLENDVRGFPLNLLMLDFVDGEYCLICE